MILLCDENLGKIPVALSLVGRESRHFKTLGWEGKKDVEWLPWVGQAGWLLFSSNKKQLTVPNERDAIIRNKVGAVYLTSGEEHPANVLLLILKRWDHLELLWNATPRPFARFMHPNGKITDKYKKIPPII